MTTRDPGMLMWAEACELVERAERLHRQFFQPSRPQRRPTWAPPVDIFETSAGIQILVALPGVEPEQVEVILAPGVIIVSGTRPLPPEARGARIHRLEIPHGRFERHLELPPGQFQLGRREVVNGCLCLTLRQQP